MATKIDRGVAVSREREVIRAVPGDIGGHIHSRPCTGGEASGSIDQAAHDGSIGVIDSALRPGVVTDGTDLIACSRSAVGMNAQHRIGDRTDQSLYVEAQVTTNIGRSIRAQGCGKAIVCGRSSGINVGICDGCKRNPRR
jgi:hypothetical protein